MADIETSWEAAEFWVVAPPESTAMRADWDSSVDMDGPILCPLDPGHKRAGRRVTDLSVVFRSRHVQDFVWTWNSECLISEQVVQSLDAERVTGFQVRATRARFEDEQLPAPPQLFELVVTGWGGVASRRSGIELNQRASCPVCGLLIYSGLSHPAQLIDSSQWDGSDIFMVWPLPRFIFVTARVARLLRGAEMTGAVLADPDELRIQSSTISPGRLSYYMPEDRAQELGTRLGIV